MLDRGVVQQNDSPESMYRAPGNRFVAQFLGGQLLGAGVVHGSGPSSMVEVGGLSLSTAQDDLHEGDRVDVLVMAERVRIVRDEAATSAGTASGVLSAIDFFGPFAPGGDRRGRAPGPRHDALAGGGRTGRRSAGALRDLAGRPARLRGHEGRLSRAARAAPAVRRRQCSGGSAAAVYRACQAR